MKHLEEQGGSPFKLAGAAGGDRTETGRRPPDSLKTDRGVLAICDDRLVTKGYGRTLRSSLPPMPFTRERDDVAAFFDLQRAWQTSS